MAATRGHGTLKRILSTYRGVCTEHVSNQRMLHDLDVWSCLCGLMAVSVYPKYLSVFMCQCTCCLCVCVPIYVTVCLYMWCDRVPIYATVCLRLCGLSLTVWLTTYPHWYDNAAIHTQQFKAGSSAATTWPKSMSLIMRSCMSRYDNMLWHKGYGTQFWKFWSIQEHKSHKRATLR